jgi:hypothetical protein
MVNVRDLYTWSKVMPMIPTGAQPSIGTLTVEYEVHRLADVRNLTTVRGYLLDVRQRVQLSNDGAALMGDGTTTSYSYPALFTTSISLSPGDTIARRYHITRADPKTLNSSVSTNVTGSKANSDAMTSQDTSGSSTSNTNTWSFSPLSLGEHSTSTTDAKFNETTTGSSQGTTLTSGTSDAVSVKDWSSFISIDKDNKTPTWTWAQTFPWDVVKYHYTDANGLVSLPAEIVSLLWDGGAAVYPPSELALFGPNFSMHATWLLLCDDSAPKDVAQVAHVVSPFTGYHGYKKIKATDWTVTLTADKEFAYQGPDDGQNNQTQLDLALLALDPIAPLRPSTGATIGFVLSQFVTPPSHADGFSITSTNNTLLVRGARFSDPVSNDAPMTADVTGGVAATLHAFFKVMDEDSDYTLFLKQWITSSVGATLTINVNGTAITRHVDALEAGGGTDNVMQIILRRKSYSSDEYFDYLVMGLNTIQIDVTSDQPVGSPPPSCGYALRALAIA